MSSNKFFREKIKEIRIKQGLTQKELAERCLKLDNRVKNGWTPPRIGYYERGERIPDIDDVKVIAIALNVEPSKLAFDSNFSIPDLNKTHYYPILPLAQVGSWLEVDLLSSGSNYEVLPTNVKTSSDSYFFKIEDNSMSKKFQYGDLVLVDPLLYPIPGDFVVAMNENRNIIFRKYKELGEFNGAGEQYFELIPLNEVFPILSTKHFKFKIIGVARQKIETFK